jgi:hypothetical protein
MLFLVRRSRGPSATRFSEKWWGLEQGPLGFVNTVEELLGRNSGSGLERQEYCCGDLLC